MTADKTEDITERLDGAAKDVGFRNRLTHDALLREASQTIKDLRGERDAYFHDMMRERDSKLREGARSSRAEARLRESEQEVKDLTVECLNKDLRLVAAQKVIEAARDAIRLNNNDELDRAVDAALAAYDSLSSPFQSTGEKP